MGKKLTKRLSCLAGEQRFVKKEAASRRIQVFRSGASHQFGKKKGGALGVNKDCKRAIEGGRTRV